MSVIREMIDKVETEHKQKLEQLNSMQAEQRSELLCSANFRICIVYSLHLKCQLIIWWEIESKNVQMITINFCTYEWL